MFRIICIILFLFGIPVLSQDRPRITLQTISQLSTRPPFTNEVVEVLGYATLGDWGVPKIFRWDATNTLATNAIRIKAAPAIGRYVHEWDGDVRVFGYVTGLRAAATNNLAALQAADAYAVTSGTELLIPGGDSFISGTWTNNHHRISGTAGRGSGANRTRILSLQTNNPVMVVNATTAPTIKKLSVGHDYAGFNVGFGDGIVFSGLTVRPILDDIEVLYAQRGISFPLGAFDGSFNNININYFREHGIYLGVGTQNTLRNVRFINAPQILTITGTATEGQTNITLSSGGGSLVNVGDWISLPSSGVFRARLVTSKTGDTLGIKGTNPRSATNSIVDGLWSANSCFFAAAGGSADSYGNNFELVNAEWGRYGTIIKGSAEPYYHFAVKGLHIEGWVPYHVSGGGSGPGVNYSLVFDSGTRSSVIAENVNILNTVLDNSACDGVSIVSDKASLRLDGLSLFEIDATDPTSTPTLYIRPAHFTAQTWIQDVEISNIKDRTGGIWFPEERVNSSNRRGVWKIGKYTVRDRIGSPFVSFQSFPRITRYAQSATMPSGLWIQGDTFVSPYGDGTTYSNSVWRASFSWMSSPSLTGSVTITNGRNWLIPDTNALSSLIIGTPFTAGGTGSVRVVSYIPQGVLNTTLAQPASASDRVLWIADYAGYGKGDWFVVDPNGTATLVQGQVLTIDGSNYGIRIPRELNATHAAGVSVVSVALLDGNANLTGTYNLTNSVYSTPSVRYVPTLP